MNEIWMPIPGYCDRYEASSLGRLRSKEHVRVRESRGGRLYSSTYPAKILKLKITKENRKSVCLYVDGVKIHCAVHRLILLAFKGPCPEGLEACHNNGDSLANDIDNLRWDTRASNCEDRKIHGVNPVGERHGNAKLDWEKVALIRAEPTYNREIAKKYGIEVSVGYKIRRGVAWKHVQSP